MTTYTYESKIMKKTDYTHYYNVMDRTYNVMNGPCLNSTVPRITITLIGYTIYMMYISMKSIFARY